MAAAAVLLIILSIVAIFVVLALLVWGLSSRAGSQVMNPDTSTLPICKSLPGHPLLPIPPDLVRCKVAGQTQDLYYIGHLPGSTLDFVVAPYPTPTREVCRQFCKPVQVETCVGSVYAGRSAQENFDLCMATLEVETCKGPAPVAVRGTKLYWPVSPTPKVCGV